MTNPRDATTLFQRDSEPPPRATRERFAPGALVAGRYRMVALLGRGGMGEVYRADDLRLDQPVALKFLPPRLQSNPEALERFLGEVRLGRQVSHPNVCRLYDLGDHQGHDFITMEYVDGGDRRGAMRFALVVFAVALAARVLGAHHAPSTADEIALMRRLIGTSLVAALTAAAAYLGLEPYVRRYQPEALISWVRLVNGRLRDPLVGRHVLIGLTAGTAAMVVLLLSFLSQPLFGLRRAMPMVSPTAPFNGVSGTLQLMATRFEVSVMDGMYVAFLLVVFRAMVRNRFASYGLLYAATVVIVLRLPGDVPSMQIAFAAFTAGLVLVLLRTTGVLGVTAFALAANVITVMPLTLDRTAFYSGRSLFALAVLIALAGAAMIVSLGRKPLLGEA